MIKMFFYYLFQSTFLLIVIVASSALVRATVFQFSEVDGNSMEETLHDGDFLFVDKISLSIRNLKRGDIVSFKGESPNTLVVKRVIGLPGETIMLEKGKVLVEKNDGTKVELTETYLAKGSVTLPLSGYNFIYPKLLENEYFLLGDNRRHSDDSRVYGPISKSRIIGFPH